MGLHAWLAPADMPPAADQSPTQGPVLRGKEQKYYTNCIPHQPQGTGRTHNYLGPEPFPYSLCLELEAIHFPKQTGSLRAPKKHNLLETQ